MWRGPEPGRSLEKSAGGPRRGVAASTTKRGGWAEAGAVAGAVGGEEGGRAETGVGGVDDEDGELVGAEVVDDEETVVGREVDRMRVGDVLARGDRAALAELRVLVV